MATLYGDKHGNRRIQFTDGAKRRHTLYLGKVTKRNAENVKVYVERLLVAQTTGDAMDGETARWVASLDSTMAEKLAKVGLIEGRSSATLKSYLDSYVAERSDVKPSTAVVYGHTRRCLIGHFGANKPLRSIHEGDADSFRLYLIGEGLSENTVRRRCGIAKQFFAAAKRKRLVTENPFDGLKAATIANRKRDYFVTREEADKVLAACPDAQWRLLFALSRYGGLRCPSEHLGIKWGDVDWEHGRLTIHSPKTEHHEGGETRILPLFPEIRSPLEAVYEEADEGTEYAITRYRDCNANLRTQLKRIIKRAGLKPWPKLFHNLRATRQTELSEEFPSHVVCSWLGNTQGVAMKHYLQTTDEHFARAVHPKTDALQIATYTAPDKGDSACQCSEENAQTSGKTAVGILGQLLNICQLGDEGLEPPTSTV